MNRDQSPSSNIKLDSVNYQLIKILNDEQQNMDHLKFSFQNPAIYKIEVAGKLNTNWTEKLGGMQIILQPNSEPGSKWTLIGQMNDQAALSGVLKTLYENRLTIISVKILNEITEQNLDTPHQNES